MALSIINKYKTKKFKKVGDEKKLIRIFYILLIKVIQNFYKTTKHLQNGLSKTNERYI
jgi:hypothetical protein